MRFGISPSIAGEALVSMEASGGQASAQQGRRCTGGNEVGMGLRHLFRCRERERATGSRGLAAGDEGGFWGWLGGMLRGVRGFGEVMTCGILLPRMKAGDSVISVGFG